ncbi:hypothetical protein BH24CHL5_BH24CHL5_01300 [soil metagenome]
MKVFVEAGAKKVFAGAIDWPGWARAGKSEEEAIAALLAYTDRYRAIAGDSLPAALEPVKVAFRLDGDSGTDFGVPSVVADFDRLPLDQDELRDQIRLLRAARAGFDESASRAEGKALATGPRGGGRSLAKMRDHVLEADRAYISSLGARAPGGSATWPEVQDAFVEALHAKVRGELPDVGPRGGERWPARYAIRRSAWHALDHAWEIEDRAGG